MHPVTHVRRSAGFTLIEAMIGMAIVGIALAVGIPAIGNWVRANKVQGAGEFYAEGFRMARAEAIKHKSASRIVLNTNAVSGQADWQVDICYPTPAAPICADGAGSWSTTTAGAIGPMGPTEFRSVFRSAATLPGPGVMQQTVDPVGANEIYYTSLGWVDTTVMPRVTRITMAPVPGDGFVFEPVAIGITMAGMANKCRPDVPESDSRRCP